MKTRSGVDGWLARISRIVLPPRCLLCGADGSAGRDLCGGCARDIELNAVACPRCALPLEAPAPLCGECLAHAPPFDAAWAPFRYAHPLDLLEMRFKFGADLAAGRVLADLMIDRAHADAPSLPDLVVAVPLHASRLRRRGFNQAHELAKPLARAIGIPFAADAIERVRATSAQTGLDAIARRRNLRSAFAAKPDAELPAHVVVLDDVMTTGATMRECALALKRAGVARVDAWTLARAPMPR